MLLNKTLYQLWLSMFLGYFSFKAKNTCPTVLCIVSFYMNVEILLHRSVTLDTNAICVMFSFF